MTARPDEVVAWASFRDGRIVGLSKERDDDAGLSEGLVRESALQSANARLAAVLALADEWVSEVGASDCPTPTMVAVHECAAELRRAAFGENNGR